MAQTNGLLIIERILRDRDGIWEQIAEERELGRLIRNMLVSATLALACYGAVLGAFSDRAILQSPLSAVKLPLLFLVTLAICLPTLYLFNLVFGARLQVRQALALVMVAITVIAVLAVAFAPISLFFLITANQYSFYKLLNVVILALAATVGLRFLTAGMAALNRHNEARELAVRAAVEAEAAAQARAAATLAADKGTPKALPAAAPPAAAPASTAPASTGPASTGPITEGAADADGAAGDAAGDAAAEPAAPAGSPAAPAGPGVPVGAPGRPAGVPVPVGASAGSPVPVGAPGMMPAGSAHGPNGGVLVAPPMPGQAVSLLPAPVQVPYGGHWQQRQSVPVPAPAPEKQASMTLLYVWILLFGFVGTQLAWTLRPFFGSPGEDFAVFRSIDGNFYVDIVRTLGELF